MVIAVDFDGTVVTHRYPQVGEDIGAAEVLRLLVEEGHQLILFTMRDHEKHHIGVGADSNIVTSEGIDCLQEAIDWFKERNIPLWGINENPNQSWSKSRKVFAKMYIDDASLGTPMLNGHVDWYQVLDILSKRELISPRKVWELKQNQEWLSKISK